MCVFNVTNYNESPLTMQNHWIISYCSLILQERVSKYTIQCIKLSNENNQHKGYWNHLVCRIRHKRMFTLFLDLTLNITVFWIRLCAKKDFSRPQIELVLGRNTRLFYENMARSSREKRWSGSRHVTSSDFLKFNVALYSKELWKLKL